MDTITIYTLKVEDPKDKERKDESAEQKPYIHMPLIYKYAKILKQYINPDELPNMIFTVIQITQILHRLKMIPLN